MSKKVPKVLICCGDKNMTPYSEFIELAKLLEQHGWSCSFICSDYVSYEVFAKITNSGFEVSCNPFSDRIGKEVSNDDRSGQKAHKNNLAKIKKLLRTIKVDIFRDTIALIMRMIRLRSSAVNFLEVNRPDVLIIYSDRTEGIVMPTMAWCNKRNIPIVEIAIAYTPPEFVVFSTSTNRLISRSSLVQQALIKILPNQFYECGKRGVAAFYPLHKILVYSLFGYLPKNPWWSGCSFATRLLVLSEMHKNTYPKEYANHITPTGQLSLDKLHQAFLRREQTKSTLLCKYLCSKDTKSVKLVIVALPQFWEHGIFGKEKSNKIIQELLYPLSSIAGIHIFLSLHPKMQRHHYEYLEAVYNNISILDERLSDTLPAADLILGYFKSVLNWASLVNVPSIYLNFFEQGFAFTDKEAVIVVNDVKSTIAVVNKVLVSDCIVDNEVGSEVESHVVFDGLAGERILNVLQNEVAS